MGFYEDDRIRAKNAIHNEAYDAYEFFKRGDMTNDNIVEACNDFIERGIRIDVYLTVLKTVLKIVGRPNAKGRN